MKKNKLALLFCFIAIGIIGCEEDEALMERGEIQEGAGLKVMHMSPNAPAFNLMVDSTRSATVSSTTAGAESGLTFGSVVPAAGQGTAYALVEPGNHTISAKVPSTSTTTPGETLVAKPATLLLNKFYTVAIVDSLSRLDAVIVEDDRNVPDPTKAYFRIANFIPNASADVNFSGAGGYSFNRNAIPFKTVIDYDTLTPGTYKVMLRVNGSATKLDSISSFQPLSGRKYTLYTRGVAGQTGSSNTKRPLIFQMTNF